MSESENNDVGQQNGSEQGDLPSEVVVIGAATDEGSVTLDTQFEPEKEPEQPQAPARTSVAGVVIQESAELPSTNSDLVEVKAAFANGSGSMPIGLSQVVDYCEKMHSSKRQTPETSTQHQLGLINGLTLVLAADEDNFRLGITAVLALFKANATECFAPNLRNRGLFSAGMDTIDNKLMRFLTRIVDTLVIVAGTADRRDALKHVDIDRVLASVPNVRARQNLTAFFS